MRFSTGNLSNKDEAGLRHAARVASVSGVCKYKLGAVVKKGGRTLGVGVNSYRTYSPNFRDTDDLPPREFWTEHAEIAQGIVGYSVFCIYTALRYLCQRIIEIFIQ